MRRRPKETGRSSPGMPCSMAMSVTFRAWPVRAMAWGSAARAATARPVSVGGWARLTARARPSLKERAVSRGGFTPLFWLSGPCPGTPKRAQANLGPGPWCALFPRSLPSRVSGAGGSGTGRSPAGVAGAAGVLEAPGPRPDNGRREAGGVRLCPAPACGLVAGQAPGCGHPFGVPAVAGRGGMGRCACGQRDQSGARPRRPGAGARPGADHALPVSGPAHPASCAWLRAASDLTCPSRIA
jgi:hypothetical protein